MPQIRPIFPRQRLAHVATAESLALAIPTVYHRSTPNPALFLWLWRSLGHQHQHRNWKPGRARESRGAGKKDAGTNLRSADSRGESFRTLHIFSVKASAQPVSTTFSDPPVHYVTTRFHAKRGRVTVPLGTGTRLQPRLISARHAVRLSR